MTPHASNHDDRQSNAKAASQVIPDFKPVALPALAAAMQAAKHRSTKARTVELPAILRKEAMLDR